jgi:hypothetical protein
MKEILKIGSNPKYKVNLILDKYDEEFPYCLGICRNGFQLHTNNLNDEFAEMIIEVLKNRKKLYSKKPIEGYQPEHSGTKEPPKKP